MEKSFPRHGKVGPVFSTAWKISSHFFHGMEKSFPRCGKSGMGAGWGDKTIQDRLLAVGSMRPDGGLRRRRVCGGKGTSLAGIVHIVN
jgi:hypothetical protein